MLNVRLPADLPGFRVEEEKEPPGFRFVDPASAYGLMAFDPRQLPPAVQSDTMGQPADLQMAAARSCAQGHRACVDSGRPQVDCLKALHNCTPSGNGLPTIFAPGIWGRST